MGSRSFYSAPWQSALGVEVWRAFKRQWGLFTRNGEVRSESLGVGEGLLSLMRTFSKFGIEGDLEEKGSHVIGLETGIH